LPTPRRHERRVTKRVARTVDKEPRIYRFENILSSTMTIEDMVLKVAIGLTPFIVQIIWKWYKRKRKDTQLCVTVEGNVLDLNEENVETLMSLLKSTSKRKTRRKRGESKE